MSGYPSPLQKLSNSFTSIRPSFSKTQLILVNLHPQVAPRLYLLPIGATRILSSDSFTTSREISLDGVFEFTDRVAQLDKCPFGRCGFPLLRCHRACRFAGGAHLGSQTLPNRASPRRSCLYSRIARNYDGRWRKAVE